MRILIDIGHPAHVHLFKNLAKNLMENGWAVLFTVRLKGESIDLLKTNGLPYQIYGASKKKIWNKLFSLVKKNVALYRIVKRFSPSISISHSSFYLSQITRLFGIPNITLEDTGNMEQIILYLPFTQCILTPVSYHRSHGKRQISYCGFHESAYINSGNFSKKSNGNESKPFIILIRFVDWIASHDVGHKGLSVSILDKLVETIESPLEVKILSEIDLPERFEKYRLKINPNHLHEFLSKVKIYIGEGATLASECALMGIPAIYVNTRSAGVIDAKVKAGLMYHFKTNVGVLEKTMELLSDPDTDLRYKFRAEQYLKEQIDLSKFLTWLVEEWPKSFQVMKQTPDYQYNFR